MFPHFDLLYSVIFINGTFYVFLKLAYTTSCLTSQIVSVLGMLYQSPVTQLIDQPENLASGPKRVIELTFRHRASCTLGQAFHYSPENAFYLFNQQI